MMCKSQTVMLLALLLSSGGRRSGRVDPRGTVLAKRASRTAPGGRCHPIAGEVHSAEGGDGRGVPRPTTLGGEDACAAACVVVRGHPGYLPGLSYVYTDLGVASSMHPSEMVTRVTQSRCTLNMEEVSDIRFTPLKIYGISRGYALESRHSTRTGSS